MLANIGPWQIGIIVLIVVVIFGTKRLRNAGDDIGHALKGFREIVDDADDDDNED